EQLTPTALLPFVGSWQQVVRGSQPGSRGQPRRQRRLEVLRSRSYYGLRRRSLAWWRARACRVCRTCRGGGLGGSWSHPPDTQPEVVQAPLIKVPQHAECLVDRLGTLMVQRRPPRVITGAVGVVLLHQLPVRGLDHLELSVGLHLQHRVVIRQHAANGHFCWAPGGGR